MNSADLAAILSSRICHDLVSPVGAVVNGVDLVKEFAPADWSDEIGMINQSASRASDLLQFYRVAFGAATSTDEAIARSALRERALTMIGSPRIAVIWDEMTGPPLARPEAKLLYLLLMCAKSACGMRGTVEVGLGPDTTMPLSLRLTGEGLEGNAPLLNILGGDVPEPPTPRLIEFTLAAFLVQELGLSLSIQSEAGQTEIIVAEAA